MTQKKVGGEDSLTPGLLIFRPQERMDRSHSRLPTLVILDAAQTDTGGKSCLIHHSKARTQQWQVHAWRLQSGRQERCSDSQQLLIRVPVGDGAVERQSGPGDRSLGGNRSGCCPSVGPAGDEGCRLCQECGQNRGGLIGGAGKCVSKH